MACTVWEPTMATMINLHTLEQQIGDALAANDQPTLSALLAAQHPADIADVIDRLDERERVKVFRLLPPAQAVDVLSETGVDATRELITHLSPSEVGRLLDRMPNDDVAEILGEDIPEQQQALLAVMEPHEATKARSRLKYPPRSAGRLMVERYVRVAPHVSAAETLVQLRQIDPNVESINDLFVLDEAEQLLGTVALRDLITAAPHQRLDGLMRHDPMSVAPNTDQEVVARIVAQYNLLTIPVVGDTGRMLGIVTVDDVIDVLIEENTEDVLRFGAVEGGATDESYFDVPIWRAVRRRVGWLLVLFLTSTLTINVLGRFEAALDQVVALSFFIPLLIGTGGNTGAQTVSTMVRGMALGDIRLRDGMRVIAREFGSGLVLGSLLAVVALGFALLLGNSLALAVVVALSIVAVCTWANTIGALVPLLAERVGLDPALVSAPLITTLVDATGLAIYLFIASAVLGI